MIDEKTAQQIREELEFCQKPLFYFHDDPDGVSSFLQMYHAKGDGKGIIIKATPRIDMKYLRKVEEYGPDKIFVLDIAMVDQEYIDAVKTPVIWLDHHTPLKRSNVKYVNSRNWGENLPPSVMAYKICKNPKDLWIAMIGAIGDWHMPDFAAEFMEKYPDLMPVMTDKPEEVMFGMPLGILVQAMSFNLKGSTEEALTCVKVWSRIEHPNEILKQESARGKFIWKRYAHIKEDYERLKDSIVAGVKTDEKFLIHTYSEDKLALSKDLANELIYLYPDKVIILAREKSGEMKCSLRSGRDGPILNKAVESAVAGMVNGTGGGHEHACGANVKVEDFPEFVSRLKKLCE